MLAMQTDMSLPKDIDRVRIEVTYTDTGAFAYQRDFERLGNAEGIRLPATLGFVASEEANKAIRVRVIASRGSDESVRILRDIVTTVPDDRIARLPVPIEFLCDGSAEAERDQNGKVKRDASGNVIIKNSCPGELTCQAGKCVPAVVDSAALPDYDDADVFGGGTGKGDGTCFDTVKCFSNASNVVIDPADLVANATTCRGQVSSGASPVNIGLRTQGGGMCGANGCFVALDFESDAGWKQSPTGTIELPRAVCDKITEGTLAGVATAPATTGSCVQKRTSIPTCGPWSSAGSDLYQPPTGKEPMVVVSGQVNPSALGLSESDIYWTTQGTFDAMGTYLGNGAVKMARKTGGEPAVIAADQGAPDGLMLDNSRQFVLWTNAIGVGGKASGRLAWAPFGEPAKAPWGGVLLDDLGQPAGIAGLLSTVYFTSIADGGVYQLDTNVDGDTLIVAVGSAPTALQALNPAGISPRGLAVAKDFVCFTYEGKLNVNNGVVACNANNTSFAIATGQATPRAIVMQKDAVGDAAAVYFASFAQKSMDPMVPLGSVQRVVFTGGMPSMPEVLDQLDYPAGLALDENAGLLYYTSRSSGEVISLDINTKARTVLASNRKNPGAIATDAEAIYWVDEGEPGLPEGAILRMPK